MPAKANTKKCCCDGCDQPPIIWDPALIGVTFETAQRWKTYCCPCVPKYVCVIITDTDIDESAAGTFPLHCPPPGEGFGQKLYDGASLFVGSEVIDVELHFRVDIETGECLFCMRSYALGISVGDPYFCHRVDADLRGGPTYFCRTLLTGEGPTWTVGKYEIRILEANHTPITGRLPCNDQYGNMILDEAEIKNLCCNCDCICDRACLTVSGGENSFAGQADLEGTVYEFYGGATVRIVTDYDNNCSLKLTPMEGAITAPQLIPFDDVTNRCPRPEGRWEVFHEGTEAIPGTHTLIYNWSCMDCGDDCTLFIGDCCGNGRTTFPRVLTAEVTTGCSECPEFEVALIWDSSISEWVGRGIMCEHEVILKIGCGFNSLSFEGNPCVSDVAEDPAASCDPIMASFTFESVGGIGCCGQTNPLEDPNPIGVVVTE